MPPKESQRGSKGDVSRIMKDGGAGVAKQTAGGALTIARALAQLMLSGCVAMRKGETVPILAVAIRSTL